MRARWPSCSAPQHREIVVKPDVVGLLPKLLWHMDEPIADTAFITTYLVSEFARQDVKVILSGVGGDELFGGYRRYLGDHYAQHVPAPARAGCAARLRPLAQRLPADRHSGLLNTLRLAKGFLSPGRDGRRRALSQLSAGTGRETVVAAAAATRGRTAETRWTLRLPKPATTTS